MVAKSFFKYEDEAGNICYKQNGFNLNRHKMTGAGLELEEIRSDRTLGDVMDNIGVFVEKLKALKVRTYDVKCDICHKVIKQNVSMQESMKGGRCEDHRICQN